MKGCGGKRLNGQCTKQGTSVQHIAWLYKSVIPLSACQCFVLLRVCHFNSMLTTSDHFSQIITPPTTILCHTCAAHKDVVSFIYPSKKLYANSRIMYSCLIFLRFIHSTLFPCPRLSIAALLCSYHCWPPVKPKEPPETPSPQVGCCFDYASSV